MGWNPASRGGASGLLVGVLSALLPSGAFGQAPGEGILDPTLVAGAPASSPVLRGLHGRWRGDGLQIVVDASRMQGGVDPLKPFAYGPLAIRDVTPPWIVFAIGPSTFAAQVEGETMTLTQPGWTAPRTVSRDPDSRPVPESRPSP